MNTTTLVIAATVHMVGFAVITIVNGERYLRGSIHLAEHWLHVAMWTFAVAAGAMFLIYGREISTGITSVLGLTS